MSNQTHVALWASVAAREISAAIARLPGVRLHPVQDHAELEAVSEQAQVLVLPNHLYDARVAGWTRRAPQLRFIQLLTSGYENLQLHPPAAQIVAANAGDALAPGVADHAVALLLALAKNIAGAVQRQQLRRWDRLGLDQHMTGLEGRTAVIVGYGRIGRAIARRLRGFGMRIIGITRSPTVAPELDEVLPEDRIGEALAVADLVILALSYSAPYQQWFDETRLRSIKPGALLVNIARGALIDSQALRRSLIDGHLAGAAIDVADPEPLPGDHPLWDAPNLLITPHIAGFEGDVGHRRLADIAASNIARYADGLPVHHRVLGDTAARDAVQASTPSTPKTLFSIVFTHAKPLAEVDTQLQAHFRFLDEAYASGRYLLSGRREPRNGSFILAQAQTRADLIAFIETDPFIREGLATYQVFEFVPGRAIGALKSLLPSRV